ncbi:DUF6461 domain-containing protein [Streptomyces sp. NPDC002701]|uniref:DUF6461 domain-containing protein n=1 Tax=Streptomyces sp. NPDC002701 TaxID=3364661 RepID=UPI0036B26F7D
MSGPSVKPLSAGGRAVTHSSNGGKPIHLFHWYEDGVLRTAFERVASRHGSTPDALDRLLREVGLDLADEGEESGAGTPVDTKARVFALTERLTGVRVTEETVRNAEYLLGHVPEEPAEDWTGVAVDITDAQGERFFRKFTREEVDASVECARAGAMAPVVVLGASSPDS